jgi:hypothetical protein
VISTLLALEPNRLCRCPLKAIAGGLADIRPVRGQRVRGCGIRAKTGGLRKSEQRVAKKAY